MAKLMWKRWLALKTQLLSHAGIRRYGANTAWLMGEKLLRMFIGLFVGIWVARYLGPEQFGLLSYAQSFVFLFTAIATLGLDSIVVRELVRDNSQQQVLLGTSFALKLIGSLCILPLLWLGVQFTSNDSYTNLLIFIIASGTIFQSFNVIDFYYQSRVMSKYVAFANTLTLAVSSIIKIALILNQASLVAFAFMSIIDTLIVSCGLLYFYIYFTHQKLKTWSFNTLKAKWLLQESYPIMIAGVMFVTYSKVDQVLLHNFLGNQEVGYFAASLRLVEPIYFIPIILVNSFFPAIINAKKVSESLYLFRIRSLALFCLSSCLLVCVFVSFFSNQIINILYGEEFVVTSKILIWQIWLLFFTAIGYINGAWLASEGLQKHTMINYSLAAILNIILNFILINRLGVIGAVFSSLISQILVYYLFLWLHRDTRFLVRNVYTIKAFKDVIFRSKINE